MKLLNLTDKDIARAQEIVADGKLKAVGYRLIVKPLPSTTGLKAGEAEAAPELAKMGFQIQSEDQTKRETKGSDVGIVVSAGDFCYQGSLKDGGAWCAEGDIVVFPRYGGKELELPPGSGEFYRGINDEDIFGKYEGGLA